MSEIKDLIKHALDQDYNKASDVFGEIMTVKMTDLLNQEQIKLAGQIYNGVEEDESEDIEIDDADLDDIEAIEDDEVEEYNEPISDDEDDEEEEQN